MSSETAKPSVTEPVKEAIKAEIAPKPTRNYRAYIFQGYVIAAIIGFGILFFLARTVLYFPIDLNLTIFFQKLASNPLIGPPFLVLMTAISWPGYTPQAYILAVTIVVILFAAGLRWEGVAAGLAALAGQGLTTLIKVFVGRPRPTEDLIQIARRVGEYSFPSGHVVFYVTFFGFLLFLALTLFKPAIVRNIARVVFGGLVLLVGPSRVYLGAHWPSDVLGAYLFGSLCLIAAIFVYRWGKHRFFTHQPVAPEEPTAEPGRKPG